MQRSGLIQPPRGKTPLLQRLLSPYLLSTVLTSFYMRCKKAQMRCQEEQGEKKYCDKQWMYHNHSQQNINSSISCALLSISYTIDCAKLYRVKKKDHISIAHHHAAHTLHFTLTVTHSPCLGTHMHHVAVLVFPYLPIPSYVCTLPQLRMLMV